jgi:hypothetical protein
LDVGADYGSTASFFLRKGAEKVIAVESDPILFKELLSNFEGENKVIPVLLEVSKSQHLEDLITKFRPDVLKLDCEGCEVYLTTMTVSALLDVSEYLVETHGHIGCETKLQIEQLFDKIRYAHETYEVLPGVEVVHAKKSWDDVVLAEQEIVRMKNTLSIRKEYLEKELSNVRGQLLGAISELNELSSRLNHMESELACIKSSFGYRLMRFYGRRIDKALPDGTRRGEMKRTVRAMLRKHTTNI